MEVKLTLWKFQGRVIIYKIDGKFGTNGSIKIIMVGKGGGGKRTEIPDGATLANPFHSQKN